MKLKSPTEPVLLSEEAFVWLEEKLQKNENRRSLNKFEKELYKGAKKFEGKTRSFLFK